MSPDNKKAMFDELVAGYKTRFAQMDAPERSTWFSILAKKGVFDFHVGPGESKQEAEQRHALRLLAIAQALKEYAHSEQEKSTLAALFSNPAQE